MKRLLVLLLIILKEAGPTLAWTTAAVHRVTNYYSIDHCSCSSSFCGCDSRGLTSVPQDLPTTITGLDLQNNSITTLSQSDFSRYSSLTTELQLQDNQISVINSGAFYNLTRLTRLYLYRNQLTSLQSDMFVGLASLRYLYLYQNNIHSIEAGAFNGVPQLQELQLQNNNIHSIEKGAFNGEPQLRELHLQYNNISTFPVDALSYVRVNTSAPWSSIYMNNNQMETLSLTAYDVLASFTIANIVNNPWQCDCRMLPVKQRMTGTLGFEQQITCAGPEHLAGRNLLLVVEPEDLNCEETGTGSPESTAPAQSFSLSAFLSGGLGVIVGSFLISAICLPTQCLKKRAKTGPAPVPDPSDVSSNPNGAAAGPTSGRTDQGASQVTDLEQDILMA